MLIEESIDIEDAVRLAIQPYLTAKVYTHKLPSKLSLPCVRVMRTGGTRKDGVDTHVIAIQYRAKNDSQAEMLANEGNAVLEAVTRKGDTPLRSCQLITHGNWGADPSRPDLSMRQASFSIATHVISKEVTR